MPAESAITCPVRFPKISNRAPLYTVLPNKRISWQDASEFIHLWLHLEDHDQEERVKSDFAHLWSRLASDFLDKSLQDEYNSIKHGLRIQPGGFSAVLMTEPTAEAPPAEGSYQWLAKSDYGSTYYVPERPLGQSQPHHVSLAEYHINWDPHDLAYGLHMISISIQNVVSALKLLNAIEPGQVTFGFPSDQESFKEPWTRRSGLGMTRARGSSVKIPKGLVKPFYPGEIKTAYLNHDYLGRIPLNLMGD